MLYSNNKLAKNFLSGWDFRTLSTKNFRGGETMMQVKRYYIKLNELISVKLFFSPFFWCIMVLFYVSLCVCERERKKGSIYIYICLSVYKYYYYLFFQFAGFTYKFPLCSSLLGSPYGIASRSFASCF